MPNSACVAFGGCRSQSFDLSRFGASVRRKAFQCEPASAVTVRSGTVSATPLKGTTNLRQVSDSAVYLPVTSRLFLRRACSELPRNAQLKGKKELAEVGRVVVALK
jgi:hypothetical protein